MHNDLKCNNVVLEKREDQLLHPIIVDFGKSVAFTKAKIAIPKPSHLKGHYKNSYIALELVDGMGKPSVERDVYSLTYCYGFPVCCMLSVTIYGLLMRTHEASLKTVFYLPNRHIVWGV